MIALFEYALVTGLRHDLPVNRGCVFIQEKQREEMLIVFVLQTVLYLNF